MVKRRENEKYSIGDTLRHEKIADEFEIVFLRPAVQLVQQAQMEPYLPGEQEGPCTNIMTIHGSTNGDSSADVCFRSFCLDIAWVYTEEKQIQTRRDFLGSQLQPASFFLFKPQEIKILIIGTRNLMHPLRR
jgi:hypothetical protein